MRGFLTDYLGLLCDRRCLGAWLLASLVLTVTGPFGTFGGMSLDERGLYWSWVIGVSLLVGLAVRAAVRRFWSDDRDWVEALRIAVVFTLLYTPILVASTRRMAGPDADTAMHPLGMAAIVFSVPMAGLFVQRALGRSAAPRDPDASEPPRLLRRIGGEARTVHRVSGRDHYVDVFTERGETALLMRFSDAVDELEGLPGLRVHRSHWVAAAAVSAMELDGGRLFLRMADGARVPVSRGYRDAVEASALLAAVPRPGTGTATGGSERRTA